MALVKHISQIMKLADERKVFHEKKLERIEKKIVIFYRHIKWFKK